MRSLAFVRLLAIVLVSGQLAVSQSKLDLLRFFQQDIRFSQDQIEAIQNGQPVAKVLPSRTPDEIFLFGAIFVHATPASYFAFATDFARMRNLPGTLAFGVFSDSPQLSDLREFAFDNDELQALRTCRPGDCLIQMPISSIEALQRFVDWSSPDAGERVNQLLQQTALERLLAYKRAGNLALGTYDDKKHSTDVAGQFEYMLSYSKALPARLPQFYRYLVDYPNFKPANVDDAFYWARVKFGLKPTLRVVHMLTWRGTDSDPVAYVVAHKQLYASHYFDTALDLSFCIRASDPKERGFYLVMAMGSEQRGLTGVKGSLVREAAHARSVVRLQSALLSIKNQLETAQ